jgi:CelD/BcsL family acetyltransferase involved in cellulose biosynthesis
VEVAVVPGGELDAKHIARWDEIRNAQSDFANPYFSPHFTRTVAAIRRDVFVGVLREGSETVGFFPFQRSWSGIGRPVGGAFSSYQGVVTARGTRFAVEDLLRACQLTSYTFTHMLDSLSQRPFDSYFAIRTCSPIMDVKSGYKAYEKKRLEMGGSQLKHTYRMMRRINREKGEYRFERHTTDPAVLRQLLAWKSTQCTATGIPDIFAHPWAVKLMERIHRTQRADFSGVLSAIFIGEELIAAEIGLRSNNIWHRWICAYDREYAAYSPGVILGLEMAKAAATEGVHYLDMGKDMTFYKESMMTASVPLAMGQIELPSIVTTLRSTWRGLEAWVRKSPLNNVARIPGRLIKRMERDARFN